MDRAAAGRVLGVDPSCSGRAVERAFRARARVTHPDRFPPGSEAWEDASYAMVELLTARTVLSARSDDAAAVADSAADGHWRWAEDTRPPRSTGWPVSAGAVDRRARTWGLSWGSFLVVASVASFLVGARSAVNDALPLWSPALAIIGVLALTIGVRAAARLTDRAGRVRPRRRPGRSSGGGGAGR